MDCRKIIFIVAIIVVTFGKPEGDKRKNKAELTPEDKRRKIDGVELTPEEITEIGKINGVELTREEITEIETCRSQLLTGGFELDWDKTNAFIYAFRNLNIDNARNNQEKTRGMLFKYQSHLYIAAYSLHNMFKDPMTWCFEDSGIFRSWSNDRRINKCQTLMKPTYFSAITTVEVFTLVFNSCKYLKDGCIIKCNQSTVNDNTTAQCPKDFCNNIKYHLTLELQKTEQGNSSNSEPNANDDTTVISEQEFHNNTRNNSTSELRKTEQGTTSHIHSNANDDEDDDIWRSFLNDGEE